MNGKKVSEYTLEIFIALITIILSTVSTKYKVSTEIALITSIFGVLVSVSIIIIKEHVSKVSNNLIIQFEDKISKHIVATQYLSGLDGIASKYAKNIMDETIIKLKEIKEGKIFLEQESYYEHINYCMRNISKNSKVIAINTIDSLRWIKDSNQTKYFDENIKAAKRGVKIHRIFLVEKESLKDIERINNIKQHMQEKNINIDIIIIEELRGFKSELEDIVIFDCPQERRLYIDYPDSSNRTNILYANLFICPEQIKIRYDIYKKLLNYTLPNKTLNKLLNYKDTKNEKN